MSKKSIEGMIDHVVLTRGFVAGFGGLTLKEECFVRGQRSFEKKVAVAGDSSN